MNRSLAKRLFVPALVIAVLNFQYLAMASNSFLWNNASSGANPWSTPGNWTPNGVAGPADTNSFGATGTTANSTTINSEVTSSQTISTLLYTNIAPGSWHVTQIPSGVTLSVTTNFSVGITYTNMDFFTSSVAMVDLGTLQVTGGTMNIGNSGSNKTQTATLDLSGLANFVYSNNTGTISMATANRSQSNFKMANASNFVTAATWNDNTGSASTTGTGNLTLGAGTNIINVGTFNISAERDSSTVSFPGSTGGLRIRGVNGTDGSLTTMTLGNRNAGATSGGTSTGTLALNGHPVDIELSTLTLGQATPSGSATLNIGSGILQFDTGTISATTINMAIAGTDVTNSANGTATVGANGTLTVGSGGISLVNEGVIAQTTCAGNLNISGGVVNCSGSIVKTTALGIGNVSITNGALNMLAGTIGTTAIPINTLNLNGASLSLGVNAAISSTNIVATTVATNGFITITIDSVAGVSAPATIPLISYTGNDPFPALSLNPLPRGYGGSLVDDSAAGLVELSVTPPPALTWVGALSDATTDETWSTNVTDANWLIGGVFTNYADPDLVVFNDSAGNNTTVTVSGTLSPGNINVNNSVSTYVFTGTGALSGNTAIVKQGTGSLTLSESGVDTFSGGIAISGGSVLLDNANSEISGGATIAGSSSLQIGNNDTSGTLSGNITDNGMLTIDRSDAYAVFSVISGSGSVVQNGSDTLSLPEANSFSGGLTINGGAVRASAVSSPGTGLITVNTGGTFVAGANHTNSLTLSNAVAGTSASAGFDMATNRILTIAPDSTNVIFSADPQSATPVSLQFLIDAKLSGSGTVVCANATTNDPDNGQGVRFRNTNVVSDFSGTIILTNNCKGELSFLTTPNGSFTPIGSGSITMIAGSYYGTNGQFCPFGTGYSELLLRNNGVGSITVGNNITVVGTGAAVINALAGTNGIVMGNLTIGGGQELIGYRASAPTNVAIFQTVSLTGGNATFTPHSSTFGPVTQPGTDFSLGAIGEQTPGSSITMGGHGNLTLSGANTYTGDTIITNGVLYLTNTASLASSEIVVAAGATFNVSELASTFTLGAAQTLANSSSTAVINGSLDTGSGTVSLTYASGTPSMTVTNGTLTLASGTVFDVNNAGTALGVGSYELISAATAGNVGSVGGTAPSSVTVGGGGLVAGATASLQITGGQLFLVVKETPVFSNLTASQSVAYGASSVTLSGTVSAAGPIYPANGETITVTINGNAQPTTISDSTGDFTITYNPSTIPYSAAAYTITYSYAGNASLNPATDSSTALTINQRVVALTGTRAYDGTANAAAAILLVANKVGSDDVGVTSGVGGLAGAGVGVQPITSLGNLALGGLTAPNYTLAGAGGSVVITQAVTAITLNSSENPSGFRDSINFTASVQPFATGSVNFKTNGVLFDTEALTAGSATSIATTVLPRGTNTITAEYAGDANDIGSTNSLNQVVTNHPPVIANIVTNNETLGQTFQISILSLSNAAAWSDADGDSLTLSSVGPTSANGVTITNDSSFIYYTAPITSSDSFSYVITDGFTNTTGMVYLNAVSPPVAATLSIVINSGVPTVSFTGSPGSSNVVQASTNLLTGWVDISTNMANGSGMWQVTDPQATNYPDRFYRSYQATP